MPRLTAEEARQIAVEFLQREQIDHLAVGQARFSAAGDSHNLDHWSVNYEYKVFEIESAFVKINDATGGIIHILHKHGYSYIDGKPEPKKGKGKWGRRS